MSRVRLLCSEAWASIRMNLSTTFAATMTVLIGMCLLGLFIALGTWVLSWSNQMQRELQVKVFFCSSVLPNEGGCHGGATKAQEAAVGARLRHDPRVNKVEFISKAEGLAQFKKDNPNEFGGKALDLLPSNPLPDSWLVTAKDAKFTPQLGRQICSAHYPGVEPCPPAGTKQFGDAGGVQWGSTVTKRILTIGEVISLVFLVAVVLLVIASTLLIANTIRLSIFARRREVEVMKLVGATNWFIRGPFMLEGLVCGLVGSALAVILLLLGKSLLLPTIIGHVENGTSGVHSLPFSLNALLLIVCGLLLGAAGSGLTLRRFLQV